MRFIDEATIRIAGGHGGPGCVSFRRETFIPRGGPDGGDGGDGGDVVITASAQLGTLQDFRFKRLYQAPAGIHGSGANKAGKDGDNIDNDNTDDNRTVYPSLRMWSTASIRSSA